MLGSHLFLSVTVKEKKLRTKLLDVGASNAFLLLHKLGMVENAGTGSG